MSESDKQTALVPAQSAALTRIGAESLVARGRADLRINEEAEEWLKKGREFRDQESYVDALACFLRGIELNPNHSELQFILGNTYEHGDGVTQDTTQAVAWYCKAAEQGHLDAQFNLGLLYDIGSGQDYKTWLLNPDQAPTNGVKQDRSQAVVWYRMAAERGHSGAQQCLGWLYENGHGVPKDYAQAVVWYRKAVNQGHSGAAENLQACRDKMTLETRMEQCRRAVEAGDREAARYHDWVDEHYSEFLVNWLPSQFTEEWLARYNEAIPEEQAQRPDWWAESMPELVSRIADATTERDPDESASDQGEKDAANKRLEAKLDKIAAKYGPKMTGHFHVQRPASEDPVLMAANEVFQKAARRKVN